MYWSNVVPYLPLSSRWCCFSNVYFCYTANDNFWLIAQGCSKVFNEVYFALCCYWNCSQAPNRIRKWDGEPQTYSQSAQNWWKQCVLKGPRALKWWITSPQQWWIKLSLFPSDTGENGFGTLWNSETGLEQSGYKSLGTSFMLLLWLIPT